MINPTGRTGGFHGVDWCVELNNLFIKVKNGGQGSNRTVARIILESPLVEIYRKAHSVIEENFIAADHTSSHSDPNMTKTFESLLKKMRASNPYLLKIGRETTYELPDLLNLGYELFDKAITVEVHEDIGNRETTMSRSIMDEFEHPEAEDIVGEL